MLNESWGSIMGAVLGGSILLQVVMETMRPYVREERQQSGTQNKGEIS